MWHEEFRNLFANYADCNPDEVDRKIFWRVIYLHAIPAALIIRIFAPHYFRLDLETIDRVCQTMDGREFARDLDRYRFLNGEAHSLMRSFFLIRISGKKLIHLRRKVERRLARRAELQAREVEVPA